MAFTNDSAAATATPNAAALNYTGNAPIVTAGDAQATVALGNLWNVADAGSSGRPAGQTGLTHVRVGYYTQAQGRANAVFTAQVPVPYYTTYGEGRTVNVPVPGLLNGTSYTFFAQGVY